MQNLRAGVGYNELMNAFDRFLQRAWLIWLTVVLGMAGGVANAFTLTVAMEEADNRPFEYIDDQGRLTGFHVELVKQVCARLGWDVQFLRLPWSRAQASLAAGNVSAVTYIARSPEREAYAWFLPENMLHVQRIGLYVRRDRVGEIAYQPPLSEMVRHWKFGAAQGYYYNDEINALLKSGAPIDQTAVSQATLYNMLIGGRVDVAVTIVGAIDQARRNIPDIDERVQRVEGALFAGTPVYIGFTRKQQGEKWARDFSREYAAWRSTPNYAWLIARFRVVESVPDAFVPR